MVSGHLAVKKNRWYAILCLRHPDGRRYDKWIATGLSYPGNKRKAERIEELLSTASPQELSRAKRLLQSNQFLSAKFIDDAVIQTFEAMITYRNGILMPYFMVGDDHALVCQCSNHAGLCVHKIALLLAAKCMLEENCPDYHTTLKQRTANAIDHGIREILKKP